MKSEKINIISLLSGAFLYLVLFSQTGIAQSKFSGNASVQFLGGNAGGGHYVSTYVYGGLRYQEERFNLSLNIPVVLNSDGSFTQVGGIFVPNGHNDGDEDHGGMFHDGSMMEDGTGMMSSLDVGLGDLYLYGSYKLVMQKDVLPEISLDGYVKFPTATPGMNIGTGKYDFNIAVSLRKTISRFLFYTQIGYLFLGKTDNAEVVDPVTFSIGAGVLLGSGNHGLFVGYDSYSTIVRGFASPKQIAIGYSYYVNPDLSYSFITSFGLNDSTSDFSLSGGINFGI